MEEEKLEWQNRYSDTDKPDSMGRWARVLYTRGFLIGWVRLTRFNDGGYVYSGRTYFPVNDKDLPFEHFTSKTFDEAKSHMERLWEKFRDSLW